MAILWNFRCRTIRCTTKSVFISFILITLTTRCSHFSVPTNKFGTEWAPIQVGRISGLRQHSASSASKGARQQLQGRAPRRAEEPRRAQVPVHQEAGEAGGDGPREAVLLCTGRPVLLPGDRPRQHVPQHFDRQSLARLPNHPGRPHSEQKGGHPMARLLVRLRRLLRARPLFAPLELFFGLYLLFKTAALLYLGLPQTYGAHNLYVKHVHPLVDRLGKIKVK